MAQRKPQSKIEKKSATRSKSDTRPASGETIERSLADLANRLSGGAPAKRGGILLRCTDSGEEYCVEGSGKRAQVSAGAGASGAPVLVRIAGPSAVLAAIMAGRQEASRAFIAGGLQVSGDLNYLESLLKELGLLNCQ